MPEKNKLVKVSITAFGDEDFHSIAKVSPNPFYLPVNPESFTQSYSVEAIRGAKDNKTKSSDFVITPPEELRLNFLFDGTNTIEGYKYNGNDHTVQGQLDMFLNTVFSRKEKIQKPYFLQIAWGSFIFRGILWKLDLNYALLEPNGDPLRIYVNTIFINIENPGNIPQKKASLSTLFSNQEKIKIQERPQGPIGRLKPPLLNLPVIIPHKDPSTKIESNLNSVKLPEFEKSLICKNAGLVLMHPFFQQAFFKFEWLRDREFKNEEFRELAVAFIHYLATGRERVLENEHFITNLLCGKPIDHQPSENTTLDPGMKAEADHLLGLAINTWGALKNTSSASFRQHFLNRDGFLVKKKKSIELHLEATGFDVLLKSLPWNLNIIEFPWIENSLLVRWN